MEVGEMRNLQEDLKQLEELHRKDLLDECPPEHDINNRFTFADPKASREWLLRAIKAEKLLSKVAFDIIHNKGDNGGIFLGDKMEKEILKLEVQVEHDKQRGN
jgi:hypothetical protein